MARTDDDDGEAGHEPSRKTNSVLWIVIGVTTGVLFVCVGGPVAFTFIWADMARRDAQAQVEIAARAEAEHEQAEKVKEAAKKARVYDRAEFRGLVMGKTEQEVLHLIGDPTRKEDKGADDLTYFYSARTTDPATGKLDPTTAVRFKFGRVEAITP